MCQVLQNVSNTHEVISQVCTDTQMHNDTKGAVAAQETSAVKLRLLASSGGSEGLNTEILE